MFVVRNISRIILNKFSLKDKTHFSACNRLFLKYVRESCRQSYSLLHSKSLLLFSNAILLFLLLIL